MAYGTGDMIKLITTVSRDTLMTWKDSHVARALTNWHDDGTLAAYEIISRILT